MSDDPKLEAALRAYLDAAHWYVRCLEGLQRRSVVRGLAEAKAWHETAHRRALEALREREAGVR